MLNNALFIDVYEIATSYYFAILRPIKNSQ